METRLSKSGLGAKTSSWNETGDNNAEELIIRNTFLNSKSLPLSEIYLNQKFYMSREVKQKIIWVDETRHAKSLTTSLLEKRDPVNRSKIVKSILKVYFFLKKQI